MCARVQGHLCPVLVMAPCILEARVMAGRLCHPRVAGGPAFRPLSWALATPHMSSNQFDFPQESRGP